MFLSVCQRILPLIYLTCDRCDANIMATQSKEVFFNLMVVCGENAFGLQHHK